LTSPDSGGLFEKSEKGEAMKTIHTQDAPQAIGPYSQAVVKNGMMFVSGQIGLDPRTGELSDSFDEQAMKVLSNLKAILVHAEMSFANVMKVTVYLKDLSHYARLNELYARFFSEPFPAREVVEVSHLPRNAALEVSLIAMK
jgi:2-iminobutanoate/2-iminopropanoate deaminase